MQSRASLTAWAAAGALAVGLTGPGVARAGFVVRAYKDTASGGAVWQRRAKRVQLKAAPGTVSHGARARQLVSLAGRAHARRRVVTQIGVPNGPLKQLTGFGQDLPFSVAIGQIVPPGWRAYAHKCALKGVSEVSWSGQHRPWVTVLKQLMLANGMTASVNWNRERIVFGVDAKARREIQARREQAERAASGSSSSAKSTAPTWRLRSRQTLRNNLQRWAHKVGWTLSWGPQDLDYMIKDGVTLQGQLLGNDGVIAKVIEKYDDAPRPLTVTFYEGNDVVRVAERVRSGPTPGGEQ